MSRLDILYVGTLPPHQGGSAVMSVQLLVGLEQRGHTVRSIAPITAAAQGNGSAEPTGLADVRRYLVSHFETSPDTAAEAGYRRAEFEQVEALFEEAISARSPYVVVIGRESFACTASELARRHRLPTLQMVQGSTMAGILRGTYEAEAAAEILERIRAADLVVTPARHLASGLEQLGVAPVHVVPNPVDLTAFAPRPASEELRRSLGIDPGAFVVAHVSNLKSLKRAPDLVAAANLVGDRVPSLVCLVVGNGPDRERLQESVAALDLESRFRFVDWVDHELVPDYLNLADIVVMPSAAEAQALVYLETQACRRVLVASDIAAARDVVEDGETGVLFPVGDVECLAEAIERLARKPRLRAAIGRKASRHARLHAVASTVSQYEALLEDLVLRATAA